MPKPKKQQYKDTFASCEAKDSFGTIFASMARHPCYQALSLAERHFYTLCRVQSQSSQGKRCLYQHAEAGGRTYPANAFVFPATHQQLYGVDRRNGSKLMKGLIAAGFLQCIEQNERRHMPNVYVFSDRWKQGNG